MEHILLVCSAGMSTSLLVTKMQKAADAAGAAVTVDAVSTSDFENYLGQQAPAVVLLGPQIRFLREEYTERLAKQAIPLAVISMVDYGMMDGESVLKQALDLIKLSV